MFEDFKHMKWLPLAGGALLCVLGLTALVWPGRVAKILPLCIGAAILGQVDREGGLPHAALETIDGDSRQCRFLCHGTRG